MEIEQATPAMFEGIYEVLREFGGKLTKDDWRRLIDYRFSDREQRGWVARSKGEIVSYLGAIFSQRGEARFCNLTSWITRRDHRKGNLAILAPMLELEDHTLLNLSASAFTSALFMQRLGFKVLDHDAWLIPPLTPRLAPRGWERVRSAEGIAAVLDADELKLWCDHLPYPVCHLVFHGPRDHLYVVASKTTLRRAPISCLHYVSSPELLCELINPVQRALFFEHHTLLTAVDARLLAGHRVRGALRWRLAQPRLYRPGRPAPGRPIDSLYTELVVLDPRKWTFHH